MIAVVQRVDEASVTIADKIKSSIAKGLLVLVGITDTDKQEDIDWLSGKISNLRIFGDDKGVMNLSVKEIGAEVLVVSQFTLHASTKKGNRPSYSKAAKAGVAVPLYSGFIAAMEHELGKSVQTGEFGADMKVSLTNNGPVTIILDTEHKI